MSNKTTILDGNQAAVSMAYQTSEVIAIYPITPSSPMGELADQWASAGQPNVWGSVPLVQEMQSEGGAAGAVHGALQAGAVTTTFTASQGLLLMIPNMYKIAGELTPAVFHVAARSLAAQALSIFGDHSDVMAVRATGWALLASASVQEAADMALIAQAATLESRIPFLHFFDGFRTSHEISQAALPEAEVVKAMVDEKLVEAHRRRALTPDRPVIRGTAQNPDVFFQARESVNAYYQRCPRIVEDVMQRFAQLTGRRYRLFDYLGAPDAERVIVLMGSGCEAAQETVEHLQAQGEKVGCLKVRLYRPFAARAFLEALPDGVGSIAVLDRTKEPGASGEPLYLDVVEALAERAQNNGAGMPRVIGGRYGLSSKEFTPAMIKAVFDELKSAKPKNHFTVGINDDLTHTSLDYDEDFSTEPDDVTRAVFYGLGSDGTVSANKNSIKIIGEKTSHHVQGYFVYDSKKAGSVTVSHLRFGPRPIHSTYLIHRPNFVACHQFGFLGKYDMLSQAEQGSLFLLNSPFGPEEVFQRIPREVQQVIIDKRLRLHVIDAYATARRIGLGVRINTVMQTCFFALSGILPRGEAVEAVKDSIRKSYGKRGEQVLRMNFQAVEQALENLHQVEIPSQPRGDLTLPLAVPEQAPEFVRQVTGEIMAGRGDQLPVSALPCDGTYPSGTARWEKRNIAQEIPVWDPDVCIQCGKCAMVCPHSVIRIKVYDPAHLEGAPQSFLSCPARDKEWKELKYTIQVAPEDCTGCAVCVDVCPARNKSEARLKAINMRPQRPLREQEKGNWDFFLQIPDIERGQVNHQRVRQAQVLEPLFEFSGACAGCGETPYIKLMTQLFGDRALVANATGCSSIYGGNLPTTPWTRNSQGRGPAWSNSLFEDNAEFGLGMRLALDKQTDSARKLVEQLAPQIGAELAQEILRARQSDEAGIFEQRRRVEQLKGKLEQMDSPQALRLLSLADMLVKKSLWIIGGDGWAYDIGFGGLDHVLASGRDVNVLVLDTEVYSNTGGQMSKATPLGAVAKFAAGGKPLPKKDLGRIAMSYGHVYVASVAMGAKDEHTLKAFLEAESYPGPSLIIAYSHCIAHGIDMTTANQNQKAAVECGYWPLYRFDPRREEDGHNPFQLDSRKPKLDFKDYAYRENRFKMLSKTDPAKARHLLDMARQDLARKRRLYEEMAQRPEVNT
ncbi:MAG TPA: pyruvate:ferredoxin (flavodoxin) oxidoreductase [Acidobacteriota bacterium]|nr:pyruvate:ferredoxin (flavodoxin) oxidoreductase [Acidobacteriota bacterium]